MDGEEQKLLEGVIAGDKIAWNKFVLKYKGLIYSAVIKTFFRYSWERNSHAEEDIYHSTLLLLIDKNYAKLKSFDGTCKLSTWLYVVTKRTTLNFINRESKKYRKGAVSLDEKLGEDQRRELVDTIKDDRYDKNIVLDKIDRGEQIELISKYVKALEEEGQYLLTAFYIDGISLKRIAQVMGKSEDAVFVQKARLLKRLLAMYNKDVGPER